MGKDDHFASWILFLLKRLHREKMNFHVVAPHRPGAKSHETMAPGIEVSRFRYAPESLEKIAYTGNMFENVKKNLINKILFLSFMGCFLKNTCQVLLKEKPRLMHAHFWIIGGVIAWISSILFKIPYTVTIHGTDGFLIKKIPVVKFLANRVLGKAFAVFTVSSLLKKCIVAETIVDEKRVFIASMPVREDIFHLIEKEHRVLNQKIRLLSVGRLIDYKGHHHAVKAVSILKDTHDVCLKIIGVGPNKEELQELATKLGVKDRISICEPVSPGELFGEYQKTDIIIHAPVVDANEVTEGLGMIVLEAFRCGVPVIGSNCGGVPEMVIDEKTGILVDGGDAAGIAAGIARYAQDVDFRKKMIKTAAEKYRKEYSLDQIVDKTMEQYLKI